MVRAKPQVDASKVAEEKLYDYFRSRGAAGPAAALDAARERRRRRLSEDSTGFRETAMLPAHNHNMPVRSIDADDNLSATAVAGSPNGTEMASPLKVRKCRSRGEPRLAAEPSRAEIAMTNHPPRICLYRSANLVMRV